MKNLRNYLLAVIALGLFCHGACYGFSGAYVKKDSGEIIETFKCCLIVKCDQWGVDKPGCVKWSEKYLKFIKGASSICPSNEGYSGSFSADCPSNAQTNTNVPFESLDGTVGGYSSVINFWKNPAYYPSYVEFFN
jgi:hypothetical protein